MKIYLFVVFVFCMWNANGQNIYREIDTLKTDNDSVLVRIKDYNFDDDKLTREMTAYLFYEKVKKKVTAIRIYKHGTEIKYLENGGKEIREYRFNSWINSKWVDKDNNQTAFKDFVIINQDTFRTNPNFNPNSIVGIRGCRGSELYQDHFLPLEKKRE